MPTAPVAFDPADFSLYTVQKPYRNGVTLYRRSVWGGNGFGTDVSLVAVYNGQIIGRYESGRTGFGAWVDGVGQISSDFVRYQGRMQTSVSAYTKFLRAIKAWILTNEEGRN